MKRIVKFRGKCLDNGWREDGRFKDGEWVYGTYNPRRYATLIEFQDPKPIAPGLYGACHNPKVDPGTVGQFIGLFDKNDVEIYEGDIISVCGKYNRVVEWGGLGWAIIPVENFYDEDSGWREMMIQRPDIRWWNDHKDKIEIIGNIHDNKDLLK